MVPVRSEEKTRNRRFAAMKRFCGAGRRPVDEVAVSRTTHASVTGSTNRTNSPGVSGARGLRVVFCAAEAARAEPRPELAISIARLVIPRFTYLHYLVSGDKPAVRCLLQAQIVMALQRRRQIEA